MCGMAQRSDTLNRRASYIRAVLAWHDMTGIELAEVIGCKQQSASKKLRGETDFRPDELAAIADHFGLEPALLLKPPALTELGVRSSAPDLLTSTFDQVPWSEALEMLRKPLFVLTTAA